MSEYDTGTEFSDDEKVEEEAETLPTLGTFEGERNETGHRHGKGHMVFRDGEVYQGSYSEGLRHGKGVYTFKDGSKYEGEYVASKREGLGTFTYATGDKYQGMWRNNKRHGEGAYFYVNGDVFTGEWVEGKKNGHGTYVFTAMNAKFVGEWEDDTFLTGQFVDGYGVHYQGSFSLNAPIGPGVYSFPKGHTQSGRYVDAAKKQPAKEGEESAVQRRWIPDTSETTAHVETSVHTA